MLNNIKKYGAIYFLGLWLAFWPETVLQECVTEETMWTEELLNAPMKEIKWKCSLWEHYREWQESIQIEDESECNCEANQ